MKDKNNGQKVCCLSCGARSTATLIGCGDSRYAVKCSTCGMNTGPRKSEKAAQNAWNAQADRARDCCLMNKEVTA